MTRDKANNIVLSSCPKLATMVHTYELSSNGSRQQEESDVDYGHVDLEKYINGNNRGNYLDLLYW